MWRIADGFKKKIKKMLNDDKYYIGDTKCGVAEHLRVSYRQVDPKRDITSKGQKLNNIPYDTKQTLLNDIHKYTTEGQYFKVLKRRFSSLRYEHVFEKKKSNKSKLIVLSKMLNSNLGNLYQVKALIDNLLFLIENFDDLNKDRINKSIDDIIDKLSFVSLSKFVREEDDIIDDLKMMLKGKSIGDMSENLEDIYNTIGDIINKESYKYIKI
eukprot:jgi/Bigna1/144142/aug1.84_g18850